MEEKLEKAPTERGQNYISTQPPNKIKPQNLSADRLSNTRITSKEG